MRRHRFIYTKAPEMDNVFRGECEGALDALSLFTYTYIKNNKPTDKLTINENTYTRKTDSGYLARSRRISMKNVGQMAPEIKRAPFELIVTLLRIQIMYNKKPRVLQHTHI